MQRLMPLYCKKFLCDKSIYFGLQFYFMDRLIRSILLVWKGLLSRKPPYIVLSIMGLCCNQDKFILEIARTSPCFSLKALIFTVEKAREPCYVNFCIHITY